MVAGMARSYYNHRVKLPNASRAFVDIDKLAGYCLNRRHPEGRHKARGFLSTLGMSAKDAEFLKRALLAAAEAEEASQATEDEYRRRYTLDFVLRRAARTALIRSAWIVRRGEDYPRFVTCYVVKESR